MGFQDRLLLNAGQKYCRMLQGEHSAILSTFIKLPFVIKVFVLSIFEWALKTGFTFNINVVFLLQGYVICPSEKRFLLLFTFLKKNRKKKIMVFMSSCLAVKFYHELLNYIDLPVMCIHVS